jgi:hypothetical protein
VKSYVRLGLPFAAPFRFSTSAVHALAACGGMPSTSVLLVKFFRWITKQVLAVAIGRMACDWESRARL